MKNLQKIKTGRKEKRAEYIQGLFNTIIPSGCIASRSKFVTCFETILLAVL